MRPLGPTKRSSGRPSTMVLPFLNSIAIGVVDTLNNVRIHDAPFPLFVRLRHRYFHCPKSKIARRLPKPARPTLSDPFRSDAGSGAWKSSRGVWNTKFYRVSGATEIG